MPEPPPASFPQSFRDPRGNERPHDGTSPVTWRVGAYVLAERAGRVLMIKSLQSGRWELPGGGVELHETLQEGAARECYEETGYRVTWIEPLPLHVGEQFFCWQGDVLHFWHTVFAIFRGAVGQEADGAWTPDPLEVEEVRWVSPGDLSAQDTQPIQWPALRRAGLGRV